VLRLTWNVTCFCFHQKVWPSAIHGLAPWIPRLLSQWMRYWWRVNGGTARELFPCTHPSGPSTRLERPQVQFFRYSFDDPSANRTHPSKCGCACSKGYFDLTLTTSKTATTIFVVSNAFVHEGIFCFCLVTSAHFDVLCYFVPACLSFFPIVRIDLLNFLLLFSSCFKRLFDCCKIVVIGNLCICMVTASISVWATIINVLRTAMIQQNSSKAWCNTIDQNS